MTVYEDYTANVANTSLAPIATDSEVKAEGAAIDMEVADNAN